MLQTFHTPTSKRQGELIRRADSAPSHALEAHLIGPCFRLFPERSYLLRLGFHRTFRRQSSAGPCRTRTHENHVKAIDYERHPATDPGVLTTRTYIGRTTHRPPPTRIKLARVPATATAVRGQDPSFHAATGPSWANLLRPSCSPVPLILSLRISPPLYPSTLLLPLALSPPLSTSLYMIPVRVFSPADHGPSASCRPPVQSWCFACTSVSSACGRHAPLHLIGAKATQAYT